MNQFWTDVTLRVGFYHSDIAGILNAPVGPTPLEGVMDEGRQAVLQLGPILTLLDFSTGVGTIMSLTEHQTTCRWLFLKQSALDTRMMMMFV